LGGDGVTLPKSCGDFVVRLNARLLRRDQRILHIRDLHSVLTDTPEPADVSRPEAGGCMTYASPSKGYGDAVVADGAP